MQKRRRFTHTSSLAERLLCDTRHLRELAEELPPGPAQNEVHRKIRQNETALTSANGFSRRVCRRRNEPEAVPAHHPHIEPRCVEAGQHYPARTGR